jgi:hypothetical protein
VWESSKEVELALDPSKDLLWGHKELKITESD